MALVDKLKELHDGIFANGEELVEAFYKEQDLEVEWVYDGCGGYVTWQVDSKFDNGRAVGSIYPDADITAWAMRKLIETIVGE